jgi:hypothetical protein
MKSLFATLGAASLLAFAAVPAPAVAPDLHPPATADPHCGPAEQIGQITFCNPLHRSRGVGTGAGRL